MRSHVRFRSRMLSPLTGQGRLNYAITEHLKDIFYRNVFARMRRKEELIRGESELWREDTTSSLERVNGSQGDTHFSNYPVFPASLFTRVDEVLEEAASGVSEACRLSFVGPYTFVHHHPPVSVVYLGIPYLSF